MELYHSDKYLGADYSDGLKHYKYIKRERINGRWVYYYDTRELVKQKDIIERNINTDKYMINNNLRYKSAYDNRVYGPKYYKKALRQDRIDLAKTNATMKGIQITADTLNRASRFILKSKIASKKISNQISKTVNSGKNYVNKIINKLKNKRR